MPGVNLKNIDLNLLVVFEAIYSAGNIRHAADQLALDLAFYVYPVSEPDIVVVPICPVDVVFIARRGHPTIGKTLDVQTFKTLRQIALVPEMRALTHLDRDLAAHQAPRNLAYTVNRLWSIPPIVERSDLIGPLPRRFA